MVVAVGVFEVLVVVENGYRCSSIVGLVCSVCLALTDNRGRYGDLIGSHNLEEP